eukprot:jgi/Botrbrau1/22974/Bobra.0030s0045.2
MEKDAVASTVSDGVLNRVAGLKLIAKISDMEIQLANSLAEIKNLKAQLSILKEERAEERGALTRQLNAERVTSRKREEETANLKLQVEAQQQHVDQLREYAYPFLTVNKPFEEISNALFNVGTFRRLANEEIKLQSIIGKRGDSEMQLKVLSLELQLAAKEDEQKSLSKKIQNYVSLRDALEAELEVIKKQVGQMKETISKHGEFVTNREHRMQSLLLQEKKFVGKLLRQKEMLKKLKAENDEYIKIFEQKSGEVKKAESDLRDSQLLARSKSKEVAALREEVTECHRNSMTLLKNLEESTQLLCTARADSALHITALEALADEIRSLKTANKREDFEVTVEQGVPQPSVAKALHNEGLAKAVPHGGDVPPTLLGCCEAALSFKQFNAASLNQVSDIDLESPRAPKTDGTQQTIPGPVLPSENRTLVAVTSETIREKANADASVVASAVGFVGGMKCSGSKNRVVTQYLSQTQDTSRQQIHENVLASGPDKQAADAGLERACSSKQGTTDSLLCLPTSQRGIGINIVPPRNPSPPPPEIDTPILQNKSARCNGNDVATGSMDNGGQQNLSSWLSSVLAVSPETLVQADAATNGGEPNAHAAAVLQRCGTHDAGEHRMSPVLAVPSKAIVQYNGAAIGVGDSMHSVAILPSPGTECAHVTSVTTQVAKAALRNCEGCKLDSAKCVKTSIPPETHLERFQTHAMADTVAELEISNDSGSRSSRPPAKGMQSKTCGEAPPMNATLSSPLGCSSHWAPSASRIQVKVLPSVVSSERQTTEKATSATLNESYLERKAQEPDPFGIILENFNSLPSRPSAQVAVDGSRTDGAEGITGSCPGRLDAEKPSISTPTATHAPPVVHSREGLDTYSNLEATLVEEPVKKRRALFAFFEGLSSDAEEDDGSDAPAFLDTLPEQKDCGFAPDAQSEEAKVDDRLVFSDQAREGGAQPASYGTGYLADSADEVGEGHVVKRARTAM